MTPQKKEAPKVAAKGSGKHVVSDKIKSTQFKGNLQPLLLNDSLEATNNATINNDEDKGWFATSSFNISPEGYEYIVELLITLGVNDKDKSLFIHILSGTVLNMEEYGGWTPICWEFIQEFYKGSKWQNLRDVGLIEETPYKWLAGKSYQFKVVDAVVDELMQIEHENIECELINLVTGRKKQLVKSTIYDRTGKHKAPDAIAAHILEYKTPVKVNKTRAKRYLAEEREIYKDKEREVAESEGGAIAEKYRSLYYCLRNASIEALAAFAASKTLIAYDAYTMTLGAIAAIAEQYKGTTKEIEEQYGNKKLITERNSAKGRYFNNLRALRAILSNSRVVDGDYVMYLPPYRFDEFAGRLIHIGGGAQTVSRVMQSCLFGDNIYHNSDLVASQSNGVIQKLEDSNIDATWFIDYRDLPNNKEHYAKIVGCSKDCFKKCLLALIMGASAPDQNSDLIKLFSNVYTVPPSGRPKLVHYFYVEANCSPIIAAQLLKKFLIAVAPAIESLQKLHDYLIDTWIPSNKKLGKDGGYYVINAMGAKLYITEKVTIKGVVKVRQIQKAVLKRVVTAFLLQGQETCFIGHLASLQDKYEFRVLGNMHDGLITDKAIPPEAVEEASLLSGLRNARLEEKPWVNPYADQEQQRKEEILAAKQQKNNIIDFRREYEIEQEEQMSYEDAFYITDGFAPYSSEEHAEANAGFEDEDYSYLYDELAVA